MLIRALLPLMKGRGWGRIVNIGSGSIYVGVPGQVHYVSAKAGIVGLTRSLAREFGDEGITVNVVAPGLTVTPKAREVLPEEIQKEQIKVRSLKREEVPEDLVGTVFFLASPYADFVTGQSLVVDGGHTKLSRRNQPPNPTKRRRDQCLASLDPTSWRAWPCRTVRSGHR